MNSRGLPMFCVNVPVFFQSLCFAVQSRSYALCLRRASLCFTANVARQSPALLGDDSRQSFHNEDGSKILPLRVGVGMLL